jgi:hypothetical protein
LSWVSQCLRYLLSPFDVLLLRALVATAQQDHNLCSAHMSASARIAQHRRNAP